MSHLQLSRCYPKTVQGVKPAEGRQGFKGSSDTKCIFSSRKAQQSALNAKELQRIESLVTIIRTLFRDI
jgi:hypothetical protein